MPTNPSTVLWALNALLLVGADKPGRSLEEREHVAQTLRFTDPRAPKTVRVDDVFGSIHVVGAPVQDVQVSGERTLRGDSVDAMEEGRRDVRLDVSERANTVDLVVDGPFRRADGSIDWNWDKRGYVVRYDLELRVPENADLVLKTVNEGEVTVRGVKGRLKVSNVNGRIALEGIAGSVEADTVNGEIKAAFREAPASSCRFRTVNGDVALSFDGPLAADLRVKTFNGEVRTDYDVVSLPPKAAEARREGGRFLYRADRSQGFRIGTGGPEISMETLNGDIVVANAR